LSLVLFISFFSTDYCFAKTYVWKDFTKPFKLNKYEITSSNPLTINVYIPAEVLKKFVKLPLISRGAFLAGYGNYRTERVFLKINDNAWSLYLLPEDLNTINIKTKHLKPGLNKLRFFSDDFRVSEIHSLQFNIKKAEKNRNIKIQTQPIPETSKPSTLVAQKKQVMLNAPQGKEQPQPSETKMPMSKHELSRSWAVIIGISQYKHSQKNGLKNLIFADDDAKAFARILQNLGWSDSHVKTLINKEATQRNILIALESWLTKAGPNDQIVLFWAGHGFPDPEDPEKVYFACYDTDIRIPATGYRMDRVRSILEERKAKNVIVLADTCHSGKLITRGGRGVSIVPNIEKMKREQNIPKGWIFMVGADTDRQAIEHTSWTNGAFTHSLIKGLSGEADGFQSAGANDGVVTMGELKDYMNTAMPDETQKVLGVAKRPVIATSSGDPDIWNLTLQVKQ